MLFSDIAVLDENFVYREHQWVGIIDKHICYISDTPPLPQEAESYGEVYDGRDKMLMVAFYNAHAHAPMTLLRGYTEGLPLQKWLFDRVFPFEDKITGQDAYWATLLACAEMARYGVVSFSDMYMFSEDRIRAVIDSGMKANIADNFTTSEDKPYSEHPASAFNEQLVDTYHQSAEGRIRIDYCVHAEYTSHPKAVADIAQVSKEKGLHLHVHVSETKLEHEECKQRHGGLTPVQYFDSLGVFENPVTAAHCVWVEEEDIEILAQKGAFVACNPASNMKLASGFAPIPQMLERGVSVALGTDGPASNNNHDFMQDMYLMSLIYKGKALDPTVLSPEQVLMAATRTGALSQGRDDCGMIKTGMKADLIVIDTSGPSWTPAFNQLSNLVYAGHGSDICLTMVDGKVVYRDGAWPTLDLERIKKEVSTAAARIQASI
ncbi:MAG: amidohydrolase [Raoultibacter sp.]|jgi:5-methylthioadenosine/S-adenosylhomocysteine deaminase